jgi:hypothetical protein
LSARITIVPRRNSTSPSADASRSAARAPRAQDDGRLPSGIAARRRLQDLGLAQGDRRREAASSGVPAAPWRRTRRRRAAPPSMALRVVAGEGLSADLGERLDSLGDAGAGGRVAGCRAHAHRTWSDAAAVGRNGAGL